MTARYIADSDLSWGVWAGRDRSQTGRGRQAAAISVADPHHREDSVSALVRRVPGLPVTSDSRVHRRRRIFSLLAAPIPCGAGPTPGLTLYRMDAVPRDLAGSSARAIGTGCQA